MAKISHILPNDRLSLNLRLILPLSQKPQHSSHNTIGSTVTKIIIVGIFATQFIAPLPVFHSIPITEASILSNVASIFAGNSVLASTSSASSSDFAPNSQEMPLLQAPANPLSSGTSTPSALESLNAVANLLPQSSFSATSSATNQTSINTFSNDSSLSSSNQISIYTVVSGDTVSGIAEKYSISINTVLWANNLRKTSILKAGEKLTILPISHTVVAGDTLKSIAATYNGDVQEIMAYNNMQDPSLTVGDTIVIPNGEISNTSSKTKTLSSVVKKIASVVTTVDVAHADTVSDSSSLTNSLADGYYMRPIKAGVRTQGIHGNNAVDLADSCGTPIYASASGTVTISKDNGDWNGGYGNYVVISHNNDSQTLYAHMEHPIVSEDAAVTQGQEIGIMGQTGEATGCHVHFEIRNGPTNPF